MSACFLAFSVQMGVQTFPHLLSGELYPGDLRAKGKSISRAISCVLMMVTLKLFVPLKNSITEYGVFFLFSGVILLSIPILFFKHFSSKNRNVEHPTNWLYLPETKDVVLEDVRYLYTQKSIDPYLK